MASLPRMPIGTPRRGRAAVGVLVILLLVATAVTACTTTAGHKSSPTNSVPIPT